MVSHAVHHVGQDAWKAIGEAPPGCCVGWQTGTGRARAAAARMGLTAHKYLLLSQPKGHCWGASACSAWNAAAHMGRALAKGRSRSAMRGGVLLGAGARLACAAAARVGLALAAGGGHRRRARAADACGVPAGRATGRCRLAGAARNEGASYVFVAPPPEA